MSKIIISKVLRRLNISKFFNYNYRVNYSGRTFKIPMDEGFLEPFLRYKTFLTFKSIVLDMIKNIANTDYFIDIGANCGSTLVEVASKNSKINYFGFEPNIKAFRLLSKIVELNKINGILYHFACAEKSTITRLFFNSEVDPCATINKNIRPNEYKNVQGIYVGAFPLDEALPENLPKSFVLKIDTEGSENGVLKGAINTIKSKRPFILCEVLHANTEKEIAINNKSKKELKNLLTQLNYKIYLLRLVSNTDLLEKIEHIEDFQMNTTYQNNFNTCDFIFVPLELSLQFEKSIPQSYK